MRMMPQQHAQAPLRHQICKQRGTAYLVLSGTHKQESLKRPPMHTLKIMHMVVGRCG